MLSPFFGLVEHSGEMSDKFVVSRGASGEDYGSSPAPRVPSPRASHPASSRGRNSPQTGRYIFIPEQSSSRGNLASVHGSPTRNSKHNLESTVLRNSMDSVPSHTQNQLSPQKHHGTSRQEGLPQSNSLVGS